MSIIVWIVLLLVIMGGIIGYFRGFIPQLGFIAGTLLGVLVCNICGEWSEQVFAILVPESANWHLSSIKVSLVARLILFVFVYLSVEVIFHLLRDSVDKVRLGQSGRYMGIAVGALAATIACSFVINCALLIAPNAPIFSSSDDGNNGNDDISFALVLDFMPVAIGCDNVPSSMLNLYHNETKH